jgi:uncharacterized protein YndB with AHSA1/START domain
VSSNTRIMSATPEQVWDVLSDGWLYPLWVVGASRMREVDDSWPQPGARLHHSVGTWPLLLDDETEVLEAVPGARLKLRAHGWPAGAAEVTILLVAHADGTEVTIQEVATHGPGALVPQPLQDPVLAWRNTETLRRLAYLVERRQQRI